MLATLTANNPNDALETALWRLKVDGIVNDSRNGRVLQMPGPVATTYLEPCNRVVFSALRDANPFFHLYEALWMLAGRNDAASVSRYAKQMDTFAENGQLWGAYGWRWRSFFTFDQLPQIIALLRADSKTRRAVLTMWSPIGDLVPVVGGEGGVMSSKDVPCNTHVYFSAVHGRLDMTVCNRSNDIIWGAYGANVVHMSILHEFVALAVGLPVGLYHQFSNNFHIYPDRPDVQRLIDTTGEQGAWCVRYSADDRYREVTGMGLTLPLRTPPLLAEGENWQAWLRECEVFVESPALSPRENWRHNFFRDVASPLMRAHHAYKQGALSAARTELNRCRADDWGVAAHEWLDRREAKLNGETQ